MTTTTDGKDARIAELEQENTKLRAELKAMRDAEARKRSEKRDRDRMRRDRAVQAANAKAHGEQID
jgi:demethoxyubiquinone hydroxylase (CLK1/Coq7/Cat5 family)